MRTRQCVPAALVLALWGLSAPAAAPANKAVLRVYVPRAKALSGNEAPLGALCVLRCDDAAVLAKASAVRMGRAPFAKETIVIDRGTILSRLAASGISRRRVVFTGAPSIRLTRNASTFASEKIFAAARKYLSEKSPGPAGCGYRLVRTIDPLVAASPGRATLCIRPAKDSPNGYVKLEAAAAENGATLAAAGLLFKITYPHRQAVATEAMGSGAVFTPHNTRLRTAYLDQPAVKDWSAPYGTEATQNITPGTVITAGMTRAHKLEIVVRRKQVVTMVIRGAGFVVQGKGEALQDGRPGQYIKIRNTSSKRIVLAKVQYDGTVSPSMESN